MAAEPTRSLICHLTETEKPGKGTGFVIDESTMWQEKLNDLYNRKFNLSFISLSLSMWPQKCDIKDTIYKYFKKLNN